jgi:2-succinyl-5-enolpyruvyl-6-hydroxy-3-cyclohexene-1-carboxylate synthase
LVTTDRSVPQSVKALVDQLVRAGVHHFCACPGSRSTPLAVSIAEHPGARLWMHLDERSAGYFALGMAKAQRAPVALLATSGTAAANFLPAVVEAYYARVPLVVLTADRPHELRDCGAPQTIDQVGLYGKHVRWFFDLAEPDGRLNLDQARHVRTLAARAVAVACGAPAGPVHLNWPFREPFFTTPAPDSPRETPGMAVSAGRRAPSPELIERLASQLAATPRGLIVCGPHDDPELPWRVAGLAERLGYPILADPLSGVRCGPHPREAVLDAYDASLRDPRIVERLAPKVVLRFGAMPTSRSLLLSLQRHADARQVVVDGGGGWNEPTGLASEVLHVDDDLLCDALVEALPPRSRSTWLDEWLAADRATRAALADYLADLDELFEGKVFAELATCLPDGSTLYVGNSMPVRDLDAFFPSSELDLRILANRGANGIDGVVSSALGASAGNHPAPTLLAIGDISFYHDLNGLLAARRHNLDLTVVLLNNDGGGIFSFLPQADVPEHFEALFGTPHGLDFSPFVEGYGGDFLRIATWHEFRDRLGVGLGTPGLHVLEVPTERQRNLELHRAAWQATSQTRRLVPAVG